MKEKEPQLFLVPATAFSAMESRSESSIAMLWDRAKEIKTAGLYCVKKVADENAWSSRVVQRVLEWETGGRERAPTRPAFSDAEKM